jgi:hypothetical protein
MSGARGSQSFGIRLALDGAEAVESGLRRVQATAQQAGTAIEESGATAGRALVVVERGTQAASVALQRMGGDAAALTPILETTGGAVGRMVTALGSGAGLVGVLGAATAAVTGAIALYQNWDTVTRGVGAAYDFLTGRVRASAAQIAATNALLREFNALSDSPAVRQRDGQVAEQQRMLDRARPQVVQYDRQLADLAGQIARQEQAIAAGAERERLARAAGLPQVMDTGDPSAPLRQLQEERRRIQSLRDSAAGPMRAAQGNIAALGENAGLVIDPWRDPRIDPNLPLPPEWQDESSGGGGGGAAGRVNAVLRDREALVDRNRTAAERYAEGMSRIAELNDRLIAQGNKPLPDEVIQREATRLMTEYERATGEAANRTRDLAESSREFSEASKDFADAGRGAAKAIGGALEDVIVEGEKAGDVVRALERDLLRIGTRALVTQPLERFLGGAVDAAGGALSKGGISGLFGSLFGSGGGAEAIGQGLLKGAGAATAVLHNGGMVGDPSLPSRFVPAGLFADAPRFHSGGIIGPDERPVIAQVGERILNRAETAAYNRGGGGVVININGVTDANSFRLSQSQIAAKMAAALSRSSRGR